MNALFLICFAIYQLLLSRSNGGREAVASTYRSFLKGGPLPRDSADIVYRGDPTVGEDQPKIQTTVQEQQSIEENEEKIPQIFLQHDIFSPENEVKLQSDILGEEDGGVIGNEKELSVKGESERSYVFDPDHQIFHNYFGGKSGKVVEEMLMAHAYIFHQNATYGGCCGSRSAQMTAHEDLLDVLGLKDVLRFRCPRDYVHDTITQRSVIPKGRYLAEDTHVWTPEYVEYLRSLVTYPERRHKEYTIVVHMLRGNTSPCKKENRGFHSYLPNIHYQNLISKYMKPGARVIIYTSAKSFESLNEFRNRGYEVNTGTSLKDTWKQFVTADVFIMSRSDFSMVPAMVAKGIVVYTPFWHHSLRRWKRASKSIMKKTDEETLRLQDTECVLGID
jgi:hypothetical protein